MNQAPCWKQLLTGKPGESLSPELQEILRQAIIAQNTWMLAQFDAQNNFYLQKLINEENVELRPFPDEVYANAARLRHRCAGRKLLPATR